MSATLAKRTLHARSAIALSALFFGCFDVKVVNLSEDDGGNAGNLGGSGANIPALLIDDFEDGNRVPSNPQFGPWRCDSWGGPGTVPAKCGVSSPGYNSAYGYSVDFDLVDANNGHLDYPGVELGSQTAAPIDISPYKNIVFHAKLVPRDNPLPEPATVNITLSCSTVSQQVEPSPGVYSIGAAVQPTSFWQTISLELSSFIQFSWNSDIMPIDKWACVKLVDGISFGYGPNLADGQATAGTLTIDYVYLQ